MAIIGNDKPAAPEVVELADAATIDIDLSAGSKFSVSIAATRTITMSNLAAGQEFYLLVRQNGAAGYGLTWPAEVQWAGGVAPTLTTGNLSLDVLHFVVDEFDAPNGRVFSADSYAP